VLIAFFSNFSINRFNSIGDRGDPIPTLDVSMKNSPWKVKKVERIHISEKSVL